MDKNSKNQGIKRKSSLKKQLLNLTTVFILGFVVGIGFSFGYLDEKVDNFALAKKEELQNLPKTVGNKVLVPIALP